MDIVIEQGKEGEEKSESSKEYTGYYLRDEMRIRERMQLLMRNCFLFLLNDFYSQIQYIYLSIEQ